MCYLDESEARAVLVEAHRSALAEQLAELPARGMTPAEIEQARVFAEAALPGRVEAALPAAMECLRCDKGVPLH